MKSAELIKQSTLSCLNLLIQLGYTPEEILLGVDDALDQFDLATAEPKP